MKKERHQMVCVERRGQTHTYYCPTCGRHLDLRYPDQRRGITYKRTVYVAGDESVEHCGGSGWNELDGTTLDLSAPQPDADRDIPVDDRDLPDDTPVPEAFRNAFSEE